MAMRECDNSDAARIKEYIGDEYYKCLYLYLDLCQYGMQAGDVKVWMQTGKDGNITAVFLNYHTALHVYSRDIDFEPDAALELIQSISPSIICAEKRVIELLSPMLAPVGYHSEFGHIGKMVNPQAVSDDGEICIATECDVDAIAQLLYDDEDIGASYTLNDLKVQMRERLLSGFVRSYVIKKDRQIVAHLGTGAETDKICTISYVITAPSYRGMGLSSRLFKYACCQLALEGKEVYSVYYPENSRRLHHKMGFEDVCDFGKLYLQQH